MVHVAHKVAVLLRQDAERAVGQGDQTASTICCPSPAWPTSATSRRPAPRAVQACPCCHPLPPVPPGPRVPHHPGGQLARRHPSSQRGRRGPRGRARLHVASRGARQRLGDPRVRPGRAREGPWALCSAAGQVPGARSAARTLVCSERHPLRCPSVSTAPHSGQMRWAQQAASPPAKRSTSPGTGGCSITPPQRRLPQRYSSSVPPYPGRQSRKPISQVGDHAHHWIY